MFGRAAVLVKFVFTDRYVFSRFSSRCVCPQPIHHQCCAPRDGPLHSWIGCSSDTRWDILPHEGFSHLLKSHFDGHAFFILFHKSTSPVEISLLISRTICRPVRHLCLAVTSDVNTFKGRLISHLLYSFCFSFFFFNVVQMPLGHFLCKLIN